MGSESFRSEEVLQAAKTLRLGDKATMEEIKRNYRQLIKKWHPDSCQKDPEECRKKTEKITEAYKLILTYCNNYRYSFRKEDIIDHLPVDKRMEERFRKQFGDMTNY